MNSSAQKASRKWAYSAFRRIEPAMVTAVTMALVLGMPSSPAMAAKASRAPWDDLLRVGAPRERGPARTASRSTAVPLPKPRPAEAPSAERDAPDREEQANGKPEQAAPAAPAPSACRQALTEAIAIAPSIPDIK